MFPHHGREGLAPRRVRPRLERLEDRINPGPFQIDVAFLGGINASQQAIFRQAAARWAQIIVGDLPNMRFRNAIVDDLLIYASGTPIDGPGGILGEAGPDAFRAVSLHPYHGIMRFDVADMARLQATGNLDEVIRHEMGHVLGIGTIWDWRNMLWGYGSANPLFVGRQATATFNRIYGTRLNGVPVENQGGWGTRDAHWRETFFGRELMTGYLNGGVHNPISAITVASLADLGYRVNMGAADGFSPGGRGNTPPPGGTGGGGGGGPKALGALTGEELRDQALTSGPAWGQEQWVRSDEPGKVLPPLPSALPDGSQQAGLKKRIADLALLLGPTIE